MAWYRTRYVNVYFIGRPGSEWVLVDTGLPGHAEEVLAAAEARHGKLAPAAILLTHGHFDHSGNARELAKHWGSPVYAHRMELPYLTGRSKYPPRDPLVGGFVGAISVFLPKSAARLFGVVQELPESLPGLEGWRWIHTPGHAPGHVSLFRESDRTLIAGDAMATVRMDSLREMLMGTPELSAGPIPFNYDWGATLDSMRRLAALRPKLIAAGHGTPMEEPDIAEQLQGFAEFYEPPEEGRYVREPARVSEEGVIWVPPRASFAWVRTAWRALAALGITAAAGVAWLIPHRKRAHR